MPVASCDHSAGTSTPSIANTVEPSGFAMTVRRRSHFTSSNGSLPFCVNRRATWTPDWVGALLPNGEVDCSWDNVCDMGTSLVLEAGQTLLPRCARPGRPPGMFHATGQGRLGWTWTSGCEFQAAENGSRWKPPRA